jgi:hypothetical protein
LRRSIRRRKARSPGLRRSDLRHARSLHNRLIALIASQPDRGDEPSIGKIDHQLRGYSFVVDQLAASITILLAQLPEARECPVRRHKSCKHWRDQFCGLIDRLSALVRQNFSIILTLRTCLRHVMRISHQVADEARQTSESSVPAAKRGQRLTRRRHHKLAMGCRRSPAPLPRGERESARGTPRILKKGLCAEGAPFWRANAAALLHGSRGAAPPSNR